MATHPAAEPLVNNAIYSQLGERWYSATDDPIALLRAESRLRNPWIAQEMTKALGVRSCRVLDVGCGGGFLSNHLGALGHRVTGLDASAEALGVARQHDRSGSPRHPIRWLAQVRELDPPVFRVLYAYTRAEWSPQARALLDALEQEPWPVLPAGTFILD